MVWYCSKRAGACGLLTIVEAVVAGCGGCTNSSDRLLIPNVAVGVHVLAVESCNDCKGAATAHLSNCFKELKRKLASACTQHWVGVS